MMERLTEERLMEIEARCDNATKGPWHTVPRRDNAGSLIYDSIADSEHVAVADIWSHRGENDAEFIAHAREDIPRLLKDLRELYDWWISANNRCGTLQAIIAEIDPKMIDEAIRKCNEKRERNETSIS
jgi:hypothetical protein